MKRLAIREAVKIYGDNWINSSEFYRAFLSENRDYVRARELIILRNLPAFQRQSILVYWGNLA